MTSSPGSSASSSATAPALPRPAVPTDVKVLILAAFVIAVGFGLVAPVLPRFATSFHVGAAEAGVVISAFAFMRVLWAPAAGPIMARIGERWSYLIGLAIVALSSLATAFAPSFWWLVVLRGLGGIGSVMFTIAAMGLMARLSPQAIRGKISGYYATSFLLGNIMGPVIGAATVVLGLRAPFIIYAAALGAAIAVAAWRLRPAEATTETGSIMWPMKLAEGLKEPQYRALLVSSFGNGWVNLGARVAIIPLLASAMAGAQGGPRVAGIALALFAGGSALTQVFLGGISDRFGRRPVILVGLLGSALATAFLGFSGSPWLLWLWCLLAGVATGIFSPAQQAALADVVGSRRSGGAVMAAFQASSDVAQILAPVLLGLVVDASGFGTAFLLCAGVLVLSMLAWTLLRREVRRD